MEQMYIQRQQYKPPQSYQAQYQGDDDFFYQQLESYKNQLNLEIQSDDSSGGGGGGVKTQPSSSLNS